MLTEGKQALFLSEVAELKEDPCPRREEWTCGFESRVLGCVVNAFHLTDGSDGTTKIPSTLQVVHGGRAWFEPFFPAE